MTASTREPKGAPHILMLPSWYPTPEAPVRGVFFQEQARALNRAGVKVGVAYPDLRRLRSLGGGDLLRSRFQTTVAEERGIPTVRFRGWNPPHARLRARHFVNQAERLVRRYVNTFGEPELVHAHAALWAGVAAERIASGGGPPYVVTEHSTVFMRDTVDSWQAEAARLAYAGSRRVVSVSRALADRLTDYVDASRTEVVPNMTDTGFFSLPAIPRKSAPVDFLTVAALRHKKGIDVLLRAFSCAFPAPQPEVRLGIVGDGPRAGELKRLARELSIAERVEFHGQLSRRGVRSAMWDANVAVVPSRSETFGVVVIEAMATGLPVVATRSGGPEEIITPDLGRLVPPDDVDEMADALRWAHHEEPQLRQRAEAIRAHVEEHYSESAVVDRLLEIYRTVSRPGDRAVD